MKYSLLVSLVFLLAGTAYSQSDSASRKMAKVYIIRATGHSGSATNMRVVVDNDLNCRVKNNRYSVLYLRPGTHVFYATAWYAPKAKEKRSLEVPLEGGKSYYLRMIRKQRGFSEEMYFEEITYNSAAPLLEQYKEDTDCGN